MILTLSVSARQSEAHKKYKIFHHFQETSTFQAKALCRGKRVEGGAKQACIYVFGSSMPCPDKNPPSMKKSMITQAYSNSI